MRYSLVFIVMLLLLSCEYFHVKKTSSEAILKEELETFNWEDVDDYPSFETCDSSLEKEVKTICFQETITETIANYLQQERIVVTEDIKDTILLQFEVSKTGELMLQQAKIDTLTTQEIPHIEVLLHNSLNNLPKIFPALKRGQQVTTTFKLPIIIHVD